MQHFNIITTVIFRLYAHKWNHKKIENNFCMRQPCDPIMRILYTAMWRNQIPFETTKIKSTLILPSNFVDFKTKTTT